MKAAVAVNETWEVKLYETLSGRTPVLEFSDRDLDHAVSEAEEYLTDYRSRK